MPLLSLNPLITDMKLVHTSVIFATAALLMAGCDLKQANDKENTEPTEEETLMAEEGFTFVELVPKPLPCSKEAIQAAWKQIGTVERPHTKTIDYRQNTPTLFISTDLDKDGNTEVLLRGTEPYAAIFSFLDDSLHLITFVDQFKMGLGITSDGVIMRSGASSKGDFMMQFIKLKDSKTAASGAVKEAFTLKGNEMVSEGMHYMLQTDSALSEVTKEEYEQVLPNQEATYFEDLEGWEDFRKP